MALTPVNSWDEFTRLREVVVGDATAARLPDVADMSAWLNLYPELNRDQVLSLARSGLRTKIIEETNEDLSTLADTLRRAGVTVHRSQPLDNEAQFGAPGWQSCGMFSYCPRDLALVLGPLIIETPSPTRARYFEAFSLRHLFERYSEQGAPFIAAPKPRLTPNLYSVRDGYVTLTEQEPVFEAANILRIGQDLLYQVSTSGNEAGLAWLRTILPLIGDLRVHALRNVYKYTHIDSTIAPLRPGLVLLNPSRIDEGSVPGCLQGWKVIWCPDPPSVPADTSALSSPWISMNLLMIDDSVAIVDASHPDLLRVLESHGITVIPLRLRHAQALGGGFHCVSLDVRRDGQLEDYR